MAKPLHAKVRARDAHRSHTKEFLKVVQEIASTEGWRTEQVLTHWLSASARALHAVALKWQRAEDAWERNEAEYLQLVAACHHPKETMNACAIGYAIIEDALTVDASDVLTPIFGEIAAASSLGQFFTPWDLSLSTAQLTLQNAAELLDQAREGGRNYIACLEPACGVGGMILAANQVFRAAGIDPARHVHWTAIDVDWRAVCGCYLQTTLTGASAVVEHGNALSLETFSRMATLMAVWHPKRPATTHAPVVTPEPAPSTVAAPLPPGHAQTTFDFMTERAA